MTPRTDTTTARPDPQGLLLVDKPAGMSSHGVVSRVRKWCGTKKVGHAGTLDPMATGVLVLGIGRGTKLLTHLVGLDKTYTATIRLGSSTPTDDADSAPDTFADPAALAAVTRADVDRQVAALTGDIAQVPSAVSAIKVDGKRSYARVRAGEDVELKARPVTVREFRVDGLRTDLAAGHIDLDVEVSCTSGTYIRALARDLGRALDVHGHLTALRRTRVGPYAVADTLALPPWPEKNTDGVPARGTSGAEAPAEAPAPDLLPLAAAARAVMPAVALDEGEALAIGQGKTVRPAAEVPAGYRGPKSDRDLWAGVHTRADGTEELVAVLERRGGGCKSATWIGA
ncbi:tRNA pseudouridine(55) synthase TruB [Brevibacterium litoralis]|uniref:tRNA pseudouridine(55) synthase TruB n=1 Tax=Brevibacterium litoralis TaxID=3138935 RepID=UPI0032EFDCBA